MKKIKLLVCSDSHGDNSQLGKLYQRYPRQNQYIFCGDSNLDYGSPLLTHFVAVRGNHDNDTFPLEQIIDAATVKILVVHGHLWDVYHDYTRLKEYMKENDISICFHGHTHIATFIKEDGLVFINPGSLMINRGSYGFGTYALVEISDTILVTYHHHLTHENVTAQVLEDGKKLFEEIKQLLY